MNTNKRSVLMAVAFAATVAAGLTGLSLTGQTKESNLDDACAHATWPLIPAACLTGADNGRTVRVVQTRTAVAQPETIGERFALAFN
jgi:hypothetical protein